MFTYAKPEEAGISSKTIRKYIEVLERANLATHDVIIARGNKIIYENYWQPFDKNFCHRMYSVTKSFVAIAAGFLIQEGKLSLDDKIVDLLPKEDTVGANEGIQNQTIRNMLMMSTSHPGVSFFEEKPADRVKHYFSSSKTANKAPGTFFEYDSPGSFIVGAVIERITQKTLLEYLREKLFDKIGVSDTPYMLKCPGGHSWSDSALLCTPLDLLKVARFTMNLGEWNGEQILDRDYLKEATSPLIPTASNWPFLHSYGYLIWTLQQNSFFFNGMGAQLAVCIPHKDLILIYNGDNQGFESAKPIVVDNFFNMISDSAKDGEIEENIDEYNNLCEYSKSLKLWHCKKTDRSPLEEKINGKTFRMSDNPMKITSAKITFTDDGGVFEYTNEQGKKALPFGIGRNEFALFPQTGYAKDTATISCPGHRYRCASSAEWSTDTMLYMSVQIIDEYFGRLHIYFSFKDENNVAIQMQKIAEDFLHEYEGYAKGCAI